MVEEHWAGWEKEEEKSADLECQVEALKKQLAQEDHDHEQTVGERDHWEEVLTDLAEAAGCEQEWTSAHEHGDCIKDRLMPNTSKGSKG